MPIIEGHHDFAVLERRLAALIREAQQEGGGPLASPVAIIAPTARLLSHLRLRLAELAPALANVHLFHHQSLAEASLAAAGRSFDATLSDEVRAAIVARLIESQGGELAAYARQRPGCAVSILGTLDDLREACIPPGEAARLPGIGERGRVILRIYAAYTRALDDPGRGAVDRAGALLRAVPFVREFTRRFRLAVHYGAYDLIGVNLEIVRAIGAPLVFLVPHHDAARAYEHARRFWPALFEARPAPLPDAASDRLLSDRLHCLFDEEAEPGPLEPERLARVSFYHAQGAVAELREAALQILALHRDSAVPLHRIGIVARSLESYAAVLRPALEELGLPFSTTASAPLLREARAQAALQLGRVLLRDFPRQPLLDLCRGGHLKAGGRDPAEAAHGWDRLSRDWRIAGGHAAWSRDLPAWVADWEPYVPADADEERRERARALKRARQGQARALASLVNYLKQAARALRRASTWSGWSDAMRSLLVDLLEGFASPEAAADADAVLRIVSEIRGLDQAGEPFSPSAALSFFERAITRAMVPIGAVGGAVASGGSDNGGVRVLDAMQARGLAFDALFLIGFNSGLLPRRGVEDPFLPDADRRRLSEALRVPLPPKSAVLEEERLLLAQILGSARVHLTISWQRADEGGRARIPSLALREVARLVDGSPDSSGLEARARRVLAHPAEAGEDALERFGMLSARDACVQAALQARSPEALSDALARRLLPAAEESAGSMRSGLRMLAAIEEFAPNDLRYDAFLDAAPIRPGHVSPSRLQLLGACPQHFFFRHVLSVEQLEEVPAGYELEARDIGARIHGVLHDVYRDLVGPDGSLSASSAEDLRRRASEHLRAAWTRHTRDIGSRILARYPLLWQTTEELWLRALETFLARDLAALLRDRSRLIGLEREEIAGISLGSRGRVEVRGRFDRLSAGASGVVVADYKTSGRLERHVEPTQILKGTSLQLPLYLMVLESLAGAGRLTGRPARAEILGVGPAFLEGAPGDAESPGEDASDGAETEARVGLEASVLQRYREGILETLGVLIDLTATGSFPLNRDSWLCRFCPYARACRRWHVPTVSRVVSAASARDYALLRRKNSGRPLLHHVRGAEAVGSDA